MEIEIRFPSKWVDSRGFEDALLNKINPHDETVKEINFVIPKECKIMIDAGLIFLSFVNQLSAANKIVTLNFEDENGVMGYLNRMGFFNYIDDNIAVLPYCPDCSMSSFYQGMNSNLVEIRSISPEYSDPALPTHLADTLENAVSYPNKKSLANSAFTVFGELINNIYQHSSTILDGYAALQVYKNGGKVKIIVSDSGDGIIRTLRPTLADKYPNLQNLSDTDLIVEVFKQGISRYGPERGAGLKQCAKKAIQYNAELDVRLPNCRVHLVPSPNGYKPNMAFCYESLPVIWGTQISFDFNLDI